MHLLQLTCFINPFFILEAKEETIPTIGFSNAEFKLLNFKVTAYDVGGGPRIRGIWKDYYAEVFEFF